MNQEIFKTDIDDRKVRDARELLSKYFLIKDDLLKQKWKISGKQVLVENYPCMEAVLKEDTLVHRAWFAPQLKLPLGPKKWRGLPGIILYMELNNGRSIISVESINLEYEPTKKDFEIEEPEITETMDWLGFEALYKKKMAERRSMYGR
ncbi:MAG: GLPGLI family protein [Owenweeksia sp.]|nr:GLPGLI family protein [Owenweeksia sp.]